MAGTLVQSNYADTGASSLTVGLASAVQSSNQLIAFAQADGTASTFAFSDSAGNTWETLLMDYGPPSICIARCKAPAGSTVTVEVFTGVGFNGLTVMEIAGCSTGIVDAVGSTNSGSGAAAVTAIVSPSTNGLAIAAFGLRGGGTISPNAGWTQIQEQESWTNVAGGTAYRNVSAGSTSHTWSNPAAGWRAGIVVLSDAGGAGGGAVPVYLRRRALMGVG